MNVLSNLQNKLNYVNTNNILNDANVGYEFEFYSDVSHVSLIKELEHSIGENVFLTQKRIQRYVNYFNIDKINNPIEPDVVKIVYDYSGGKSMFEIITPPRPYFSAKILASKILSFIKKNGYTTKRCGLHINISFKSIDVQTLDTIKFALDIDENFIYEKFPNRKNNVYSKSIKFFVPDSIYYNENQQDRYLDTKNIKIPFSKYFGVNFSKLEKKYLEFRYLGGKDYENKIKDIHDLTDYFILQLYETLKNEKSEQNYISALQEINNSFVKRVVYFSDLKIFRHAYPNIRLFVDLKEDIQIIKTYFNQIKKEIFDLIYLNGMIRGDINYDSSKSRLQIKNAVFSRSHHFQNIDIVSSKIENSVIDNCMLYNVEIDNCEIYQSQIYYESKIKNSILFSCYVQQNLDISFYNCYVDAIMYYVFGVYYDCIIRSGYVDDTYSKIEFNNEIIDNGTSDKDKKHNKSKKYISK